jgi:hypothetical protein
MTLLFYVSGDIDMDVDTEAAIRHIEMQGDAPELGQAGPVNTYQTLYGMDTEPKPGTSLSKAQVLSVTFASVKYSWLKLGSVDDE